MRKLILLFIVLLTWPGCSGQSALETGDAGPQPAPQPAPPSTGLRSVVLGTASGPRLDSIARVTALDAATPDPATHEVLIADASVGAHPTVRAFLDAGKTVVFLNATAAVKNGELLPLTHLATRLDSGVLCVRRSRDAHGRSSFQLFDWPVTQGDDVLFEHRLAAHLLNPGEDDPGFDPPTGLVYASFSYEFNPVPAQDFTQSHWTTSSVPQIPALKVHAQFKLFLDQSQPGGRQILAAGSSIEASPFDPFMGLKKLLAGDPNYEAVPEAAWFQVGLSSQMQPDNDGVFQMLESSPNSAEKVSSVVTGLNQSIVYLTPEPATYQYVTNATRDLNYWKVEDLTSGDLGSWQYYSADPFAGDDFSIWESGQYGGALGYYHGVDFPNDLSSGVTTLKTNTQVAWASFSLLDSVEGFTYNVSQLFAQASYRTKSNLNLGNYLWFAELSSPSNYSLPFNLDLSIVEPVAIQSLTLAPNPAFVSDSTSLGVLTLAEPARIDTTFVLKSNSPFAVLETDTVTIAAGQTQETFLIQLNGAGIAPGQQAQAEISASAGSTITSTLTIQN